MVGDITTIITTRVKRMYDDIVDLYSRGHSVEYKFDKIKDSEKNTIEYVKNSIRNNTEQNVLKMFGIDNEYTLDTFYNFRYEVNNYNFRDHKNFHKENSTNEIWCFGCSFTYGVGVAYDYIWPSVIQRFEPEKIVRNFGVGASGPQTTLRLLKNWLTYSSHNPTQVYILGFFPTRCEFNVRDEYHMFTINHYEYYKNTQHINDFIAND